MNKEQKKFVEEIRRALFKYQFSGEQNVCKYKISKIY